VFNEQSFDRRSLLLRRKNEASTQTIRHLLFENFKKKNNIGNVEMDDIESRQTDVYEYKKKPTYHETMIRQHQRLQCLVFIRELNRPL
jgi:hypothetical protein